VMGLVGNFFSAARPSPSREIKHKTAIQSQESHRVHDPLCKVKGFLLDKLLQMLYVRFSKTGDIRTPMMKTSQRLCFPYISS